MRCVLTEVVFLVLILSGSILGAIRENVNPQFLSRYHLEAIHIGCSQLGMGVLGELHNRVSLILSRVWVLWELNCIDLAESGEPLANVLLGQLTKLANQTTHIDPIVELSLLVLVSGGQCIAH
jgi:hypothetical protein